MLTRRDLRIKAMQAVYAYLQVEGDLQQAEKQLVKRTDNIFKLYLFLVDLLFEVVETMRVQLEDAKAKKVPTRADLDPNLRFVNNPVLVQMENNAELLDLLGKNKVSWKDEDALVRNILQLIKESEIYKIYMAKSFSTTEEDKTILIQLFEAYIANHPDIELFFEEKDIYWADDLHDACNLFVRSIQQVSMKEGVGSPLPDLFKKTSKQFEDEDRLFMVDLFRKTIINANWYQELISARTKNWKVDRIAQMDVVLMMMALCEFMEFKDIPVKVSLNEYIEIAKEYSTPKSKVFINGVLDKLIVELQEQGKINKSSKGLQ